MLTARDSLHKIVYTLFTIRHRSSQAQATKKRNEMLNTINVYDIVGPIRFVGALNSRYVTRQMEGVCTKVRRECVWHVGMLVNDLLHPHIANIYE